MYRLADASVEPSRSADATWDGTPFMRAPGRQIRNCQDVELNMATENLGIALLHSRRAFDAGDATESSMPGQVSRHRQRPGQLPEPFAQEVRAHLDHLLHSPHFDGSARSREFLSYVVGEVLAGRAGYLKQATIAVEVFGRRPDFDAVIDPIVRVQAGRLRRSLERFYLLCGDSGSMRIELPKGSYAPVFIESRETSLPEPNAIQSVHGWPTVVVHPFAVHSSRDSAAAVQLVDELTAELGRYGILHVARPMGSSQSQPMVAAARFELHGIARDLGGTAQFAARLVDRGNGQQIWADEFHSRDEAAQAAGNPQNIGRLIAARIGAEHGVVARLMAGEQAARGFPAGDAFGAIARCQHFLFSRQVGALVPAIESLQQLTHRAPEIELAWTSLARLYLMNHSFELSGMFTPVEMAIGCANQSVLLEPSSARTRCLMATALLVKGELAAARRELDLALRPNSDSLAYREVIGWLTALCGDWDQGVALMRTALEHNPYCQPCVSHGLWADAMRRRDFNAAYAAALEYREPTFFWRELMITSCLGQLERFEEARASAAELLHAKPLFAQRGRRLIAHYIKSDDLRATIVEGLRKAGVEIA
jgi:adenylate cyclase